MAKQQWAAQITADLHGIRAGSAIGRPLSRSLTGWLATGYCRAVSGAIPYDPSPAVLRTLTETFWSPVGWRSPPKWPEQDAMDRAVRAGIMFTGVRRLDHDGWVLAAIAAAAAVSAQEAADAFLASLTTRRLDLRSALGSLAVARHLPGHPFTIPQDQVYDGYAPVGPRDCAVCGFRGHEAEEQDLNLVSFERFKWGGVHRHSVSYIAFDLEQFARAPARTREMPTSPWLASSSATCPDCPPPAPPRRRLRG